MREQLYYVLIGMLIGVVANIIVELIEKGE